jgi:hypothetical protein
LLIIVQTLVIVNHEAGGAIFRFTLPVDTAATR